MKATPRGSYLLASTVFGSSLIGVAMGVALPFFLAPREYAQFSLNLALVQLLSSVAFEWIRVSVLRLSGGQQAGTPLLRLNLKSLYINIVLVLFMIGVILGMLAVWLSALLIPALVFAVASVQGAFDGRSAWARAKFDNAVLARATLVRPALSLTFVIGLAMATGSGTWAMTGMLVSYPLASLVFRDKIAIRNSLRALDRETSLSILHFGAMSAFGTNAAMAVPVLLRMIIVALLGLSGAGGVLLAFDIGQRIFSTVGMSLNLLHFQTLLRAIDNDPIEVAIQKVRSALAIEAVLFVGIVTMITAAAGPIGKFLAPSRYEIDFSQHLPTFSVLMAILCLRQYAIDSLFIAFRKVKFIAVAPIVTFVLYCLTFGGISTNLIPREYFLVMLVLASAVGFAIPIFLIANSLKAVVPYETFAASVFAACLATMFTSGISNANSFFALVGQSGASLAVYCTVLGGLASMHRLLR